MNRVLVVGSTGAGKTTVGRKLASRLGVPFVELDGLFWLPNWTEAPGDVFVERITDATRAERWVADGDYWMRVGTTLWERADTVVWLDTPLWRMILRLVRRTIGVSVLRTNLWGTGNRQSISVLWSHGWMVGWARKIRDDQRAWCEATSADPRFGNVEVIRLRSPREVRRFVAAVDRRTHV